MFFLGVAAIMVATEGLNMFVLFVFEQLYMSVTQITSNTIIANRLA